ncbi:MAG: SpoIIE family protein phosphatase [Syntrophobacteraceae bacterium]
MRNKGLAFKLILFILSGTTIIFLSAFTYYYLYSKKSVVKYVEENARNLTLSKVHEIETILRSVEKVPLNYASFLSMGQYDAELIHQLTERMVSANPEIYGAAVAFEPYSLVPGSCYFSPYCYRESGSRIVNTMLGDYESYNYFTMDWYQIPKELNRAIWTEPYFDEGGGNEIMATFSVPFYRMVNGGKRFQGIVTSDVALKWLQDVVSEIKVFHTGYAFLISRNGVFITHPDSSLIMKHTIFSVAEAKGSPALRRMGRAMINGEEGLVAIDGNLLSDTRSWVYYAPLSSIGWTLGIVIPEDALFADVHSLGQKVVLIVLGGLLLMALVIMLIAHRITGPLKSLAATTVQIAHGDLDTELPEIRTGDEIGRLAVSFDSMRIALKDYVKNLTETTAAKAKIESELKVAHNIQMSFLPRPYPPLRGKHRFDIYASLEPAREVGGDFYDYFLLDDDHLFFTVGDVSDKGVPAALYMAVTKTLLKGIAENNMEPSDFLNKVNLELCRDNDSMMFVTLVCGVIDLRTGLFRYSNAAHEPPVIVRKEHGPDWLELPDGFMLGAMEESKYITRTIHLQSGDKLLLYTDGVTESLNVAGELYSGGRLMDAVRSRSSLSAEGLTRGILESVKQYSTGTAQADDITVLVFGFIGD